MDGASFWQKRFREWLNEFFRYARFIFNDHLMIILILAIGAGTYYYQDWVQMLSPDFPGALLFTLLFSWLLITGHITTFLKAPDTVFLLPVETRLRPYFLRSFFYTYIIQGFGIVVISLILAPVYIETIQGQGFLSFLVLVLLLKGIHLWIRWHMYYETDPSFLLIDRILCFALNGGALYLFLNDALFLSLVVFALLGLYGLSFAVRNREKGLPWEVLIALEEQRLMRFYRFANLFTDVPHLRDQVKRRKVFDGLVNLIPANRKQAEFYLLARTFLRSGDYFGIFIRLSIIGGIIVWGFKGSIPGIVAAVLFIYLTGMQLHGLWKHHDAVIWSEIYPFEPELKRHAFSRLLTILLSLQHLWFTFFFLLAGDWLLGIIFFVVLGIVIYWFVHVYVWRGSSGQSLREG